MSGDVSKTTADPLSERLLRAALGGCTCLTKSPDIRWHDQLCHYRLFTESLGEIGRLKGMFRRLAISWGATDADLDAVLKEIPHAD
jgi:hypothetical protein